MVASVLLTILIAAVMGLSYWTLQRAPRSQLRVETLQARRINVAQQASDSLRVALEEGLAGRQAVEQPTPFDTLPMGAAPPPSQAPEPRYTTVLLEQASRVDSALETLEPTVVASEVSAQQQKREERAFMAKFFFSLIFTLAALYVVLSRKYPEEIQRWAFSILALVAGVWIGTVT